MIVSAVGVFEMHIQEIHKSDCNSYELQDKGKLTVKRQHRKALRRMKGKEADGQASERALNRRRRKKKN